MNIIKAIAILAKFKTSGINKRNFKKSYSKILFGGDMEININQLEVAYFFKKIYNELSTEEKNNLDIFSYQSLLNLNNLRNEKQINNIKLKRIIEEIPYTYIQPKTKKEEKENNLIYEYYSMDFFMFISLIPFLEENKTYELNKINNINIKNIFIKNKIESLKVSKNMMEINKVKYFLFKKTFITIDNSIVEIEWNENKLNHKKEDIHSHYYLIKMLIKENDELRKLIYENEDLRKKYLDKDISYQNYKKLLKMNSVI